MLCDRCHGREAVVHVTQIVNGHRTEKHLCRECAAKENLMHPSMDFSDMIYSETALTVSSMTVS